MVTNIIIKTLQFADVEFDGVNVRVFSPVTTKPGDDRPALVYIHGGGWTFGSPGITVPLSTI